MIFGLATGTFLIILGILLQFFFFKAIIYKIVSIIPSVMPLVKFLLRGNNARIIGIILIALGIYLSGFLIYLRVSLGI